MIAEIRRGILFTLVTMALFGAGYPMLVWGMGRAFPHQAEGSLLRRPDGSIAGSTLIAQSFTGDRYFHPRPSAVDYNAASAGGSNYGPAHPDQRKLMIERRAAFAATEGVEPSRVPAEMVTASGGGLDPHISPAAAELQIARVARARGIDPSRVRALVRGHVEGPALGIFGGARVNVLELNLAMEDGQ
jgi:potassium-transporting ATPase KdpC subunit